MTSPLSSLKNAVAIVTGGTQGLGETIARTFAERGAAGLVICGRNADKGKAVAAAITAQGCRTEFVTADLAEVERRARLRNAPTVSSAASTFW